jgi:PAS domain S-box-containing protein
VESSETPDWLVLLDREGPDLAVVLDEQYRIVWGSHSNTAITGITGPSDTSSLLEPTSLAPFVEAVAESRRRPGEAVPLEFSFRCPIGVVRAHGWLVDISHTRPGHTLLRFCILDHPQDPATPRGDGESNRASPRSGDQGDALDEPLHLMAEMSTLGLGMALPGGHLLYRNRAFEEWFPARVVDGLRGIAEAVRPEAAGALREWVDKVTRGESASVIVPLESGSEHRWLRLDGAERTSATLGRLHGITVQDVSEVVAGRDSMRQVLDLMPVMVFASDLDGRVKFANQTGRTFLGTCSEELDDLRLGSILGEIVGEDLLHTIGDLTGTGHVVADLENTVKALDGTEHHLRTWLLPFQDASSGENTILVVANDETRQVANEALLTALGRNMADLAIISHFDGGRSFVSASVQELLGWAPDEFLTFPVLDTIHPDDIAKSAVIRDPELSSAGSSHTLELRLLHRDGTWRWFEVNATNLSNVPAIRGMLIFGHDIMARKARDQQLEFEATHDPLTSLLNRSAIIDRLSTRSATPGSTAHRSVPSSWTSTTSSS